MSENGNFCGIQDLESEQCKITKIADLFDLLKILESTNKKYLFRGEPCRYTNISSSLWREYGTREEEFLKFLPDDYAINYNHFEKVTLKNPRACLEPNIIPDEDIISVLRHSGGKNNCIDFSKSVFVSLCFACSSNQDCDGRLILFDLEYLFSLKGEIQKPVKPEDRVERQHSIFLKPTSGILEAEKGITIIIIDSKVKLDILDWLDRFCNLSLTTLYNDILGSLESEEYYLKEIYPQILELETVFSEIVVLDQRKNLHREIIVDLSGHGWHYLEELKKIVNRGIEISNRLLNNRIFAIQNKSDMIRVCDNQYTLYLRNKEPELSLDSLEKGIKIALEIFDLKFAIELKWKKVNTLLHFLNYKIDPGDLSKLTRLNFFRENYIREDINKEEFEENLMRSHQDCLELISKFQEDGSLDLYGCRSYIDLGDINYRLGKFDEAEKHYIDSLRLNPNDLIKMNLYYKISVCIHLSNESGDPKETARSDNYFKIYLDYCEKINQSNQDFPRPRSIKKELNTILHFDR